VLTYLLGLDNVRNYDGSWTEWGNKVGAPIEKARNELRSVVSAVLSRSTTMDACAGALRTAHTTASMKPVRDVGRRSALQARFHQQLVD
jgi:hypothetical protein